MSDTTLEPNGPSAFVQEAYELDDQKDMVEFYRKWAEDYDHQMMVELEYESPTRIAEMLSQFQNKSASVLDIGCGTGLTGLSLHNLGFECIDGIDLSPDMIGVAGQRGIYRDLMVGDLNLPLDIDDVCYDAIISSGTFTHGHVGSDPIDEVLRVLKPGGMIACTVHKALWETRGFKQKFETLQVSKAISCLMLEEGQYFTNGELEGWFCVYRKSE
ncbi:MAG: putative TPR repeat methyltransferase [Gammaproteobacteria bacterium]|jgi:predicted TPR repeat methyltransferase